MSSLTASLSDWLVGDGTVEAVRRGDLLWTLLTFSVDRDAPVDPASPDDAGWTPGRSADPLCTDYTVTGLIKHVEQHRFGGFLVLDAEPAPVVVMLGPRESLPRGEWIRVSGSLVIDPYDWYVNVQDGDLTDWGQRAWRVDRIWGAPRAPDDPADPSRLMIGDFHEIDAVPEHYVGGRESMPAFRLRLSPVSDQPG